MAGNQMKLIEECLGLPFDVFAESWVDEDGPSNEDYRVMQRCLLLLGYPTGPLGQPCLDGVIGPNARRALRQYQQECDFEGTAQFDVMTRRALYHTAADFLAEFEDKVIVGCAGQLRRVANQPGLSGKEAVYYFQNEAKARVEHDLLAAFLLLTTINAGITVAALDLLRYEQLLTEKNGLREARMASLHYGFLQLRDDRYEELGQDVNRARVCGDIDFHLDTIARVLESDAALRDAAVKRDLPALATRFPFASLSNAEGVNRLKVNWAEIETSLPK